MKKFLKILGSIIGGILVFFLIINIIPPSKAVSNNPFIAEKGDIMVAAHRGGHIHNPQNTIKAFDAAVNEFDVDILEMDLVMTKDEEAVIIHNEDINDYCDVVEVTGVDKTHYVKDFTYDELQEFNFGYKFKDEEGNTPYKDLINEDNKNNRKNIIKENNLNIIKIEELFERFYETNKDLLFIIEIKNSGEEGGYIVADKMNSLLTGKYKDYSDNVVIGTFNGEIERYLQDTYPSLLRGASVDGATEFIVTQLLKVNLFSTHTFACLQIPTEESAAGITLDLLSKDYVDRAHRRNIAVQYWTINDRETMEKIIELGADCIMTDNPKLLNEVLKEKGIK